MAGKGRPVHSVQSRIRAKILIVSLLIVSLLLFVVVGVVVVVVVVVVGPRPLAPSRSDKRARARKGLPYTGGALVVYCSAHKQESMYVYYVIKL